MQEDQSKEDRFWNPDARNNALRSKIKNIGIGFLLFFIITILILGVDAMLAILILSALIVIAYFIFRKTKNPAHNQPDLVFIGSDSKGRPVFEKKNPDGSSSMAKMNKDGIVEIDISDFDAGKGNSCFKPSEALRRHLVALEKGLVPVKNDNGDLQKYSDGSVIYKDSQGNYIDNPDDYTV